MRYYRVVFENILTKEVNSTDILADSPTEAKNEWKYARNHAERQYLSWCGTFATPSRLFTDEDFS